MDRQVKIIIERLNKHEIKKINNYLINLKKNIGEDISATILDPRPNSDYNNLIEYYEHIYPKLPMVNIKSFYLSLYLVSDETGNVNSFIRNYIGKQKYNKTQNKGYFLPSNRELINPVFSEKGNLVAVEFSEVGGKPYRRISVNRKGNVQVIRNFDKRTHTLLSDEYLDTNLNIKLKISFNGKGQRESYYLVSKSGKTVFSEIDLFDEWFEQAVKKDDYVINMNQEFNIVFANKHDSRRLFLM